MRAAFYSDLVLKKIDFEGARPIYLEWALGIRRFDRYEEVRRAAGIDPRWPLRELHEGASLSGDHDACLSTRRGDALFLLHLQHRDEHEPSEFWHNVAELSPEGAGTRIRHACGRSGPAGHELRPAVGAPSVIRRLLRWNGPDVEPRSVGDASVIRVADSDASDVVRYFVLDRARRSPIALLTPARETEQAAVDPQTLAMRLAGLVRVLHCVDEAAARAFSRALQHAGFAFEHAAGDGAIRLYLPDMDPGDPPYRHRFWTRAGLDAFAPDVVTGLAGALAEAAVRGTIPRVFFRAIERFDRAAVERRTDALLQGIGVAADLEQERAQGAELRAQLAAMRRELDAIQADLDASLRLMEEEVDRRHDREQRLEEARARARDAEQQVVALRSALEARSRGGGLSPPQREALAVAVDGSDPTPDQCLDVLACLYGERVEILESARDSARRAAGFKHGKRLLDLLVRLATDYWRRMVDGGGDAQAKEVFGDNAFAAKESRTAMGNDRARRERTFDYGGERHLMWRHLKIGAKDTTEDSIRVYFDWLADERRILIGHCGEHLYLPSYGM